MFRLTNPPIHPPKKTPTNGWGILHRFQIFKQNRNILIRSSLIAFLLISGGTPPGGWVGGGGVEWGHPPRTCTCARMNAHTCAHTHVKHDKHGCLHGGGHLQFSNMFIFMFRACAYVHVHVHMSRDIPPCPQMPPNPSAPSPEPQGGAGSPNHQKFISAELIEIIRFCLKNLYLWTFLNSSRLTLITLDTPHPPAPPPWAEEAEILKTL